MTSGMITGVAAGSLAMAGGATAAAQPVAAANPVIVVAGFSSPAIGGLPLAARLQANGTKAYYTAASRDSGTGDITVGAQDLGVMVDKVLKETGATKVDLVGLSMGSLTSRYYVKSLGGDAKVDHLVTVAGPNYGTNRANWAKILNCVGLVSCEQMAIGSDFLNDLNAGSDTIGSVKYTTFRSSWDEVVVPIDNAKLKDGATNILLQDQCPLRFVEHQLSALDGTIADGVMDALANKPVQMNCFAI
ncbi:hypothetical protein VV02_05355 [Luteipulveratus mongoliensis]|uniref:Lipase n=1 Tax=Luteipulveratus mongoliensis TaxID=571913 RepID=A0A0K1JQ12_9MICO|nr:hypothetical protein VV02_05355 [Luteipulveratus mongoliensis]